MNTIASYQNYLPKENKSQNFCCGECKAAFKCKKKLIDHTWALHRVAANDPLDINADDDGMFL